MSTDVHEIWCLRCSLKVSRAHFYGVCERDVFVEPRSELHRLGFVAIRSCEWILPWRRFCDCGSRTSIRDLLKTVLHEKFDTKCIDMIGAAEYLDKEMEVLHRTVRVIN